MEKSLNFIKILMITLVVFFIGDNHVFQNNSEVVNDNLNKKVSIGVIESQQKAIAMAIKKEEMKKLMMPKSTFTGSLTGYSAECEGCSGNLACTGTNVNKNGVFYNDNTYGRVRIVATSSNYPCGTILKFNLPSVSSEPIIAIALDKGVSGNTVDLLVESNEYALKYVGRANSKEFGILRLGW